MNYTFIGIDKIITPTDAPIGGVIDFDIQDLYSRWVDWFLTSDNSKFLPAMRSVGGDPLPGSKKLGITYFLLNGWKIRPYEASHIFNVDGNLYCEDGSSPYVSTLGIYNVMITSSVSNLVDSTVQQLPEIEYASYNGGVTIDVINGVAGTTYPLGTGKNPVDNLADAKTIANTRGFDKIYIIGNITIDATDSISGLTIVGQDGTAIIPKTTVTLVSGCTTSNTFYEDCKIVGRQGGESVYRRCIIGEMTNVHCQFDDCTMIGSMTLSPTAPTSMNTTLNNCHSNFDWFVVDYNDSQIDQNYNNWNGKIKFLNIIDSDVTIIIRMDSGQVWIDASCTVGNIIIEGVGAIIDDSTGTTIDKDRLISTNKLLTLAQYIALKG